MKDEVKDKDYPWEPLNRKYRWKCIRTLSIHYINLRKDKQNEEIFKII